MLVGVIADTHGVLDPAVMGIFAGVEHIIHAGDVGERAVLEELGALAPVTAVRGHGDAGAWAAELLGEAELTLAGTLILVGHVERTLVERHRPISDFDIVISGHTHTRRMRTEGHTTFLCPGSATLPSQDHGRSVAVLRLSDGDPEVTFVELGDEALIG